LIIEEFSINLFVELFVELGEVIFDNIVYSRNPESVWIEVSSKRFSFEDSKTLYKYYKSESLLNLLAAIKSSTFCIS
jgi:hypothetical protein